MAKHRDDRRLGKTLANPQLWTHIYIPPGATWGRVKVKVYLSRSGAMPLDLFLEIPNNDNDTLPLVTDIINLEMLTD
jgi:hypothetical protein